MIEVDNYATQFFNACQHTDSLKWFSGYCYNMGVLAVRHNELDEAGDKLALAIECYKRAQEAWWWIPLVHVQTALVFAKEQRFEMARLSLQAALSFNSPLKAKGWHLFAAAYLVYQERPEGTGSSHACP